MKQSNDHLERVLALARRAEKGCAAESGLGSDPAPLPVGFATRVAALWALGREVDEWDIWDRMSRWGLGLALAVCVAAFLFRGSEPEPEPSPFDLWVAGSVEEGRS